MVSIPVNKEMKKLIQCLLRRDRESYKYQFGHILFLGGSPGLSGAIYLASQAALKIGAGLVTLGIPSSLNSIMEIKTTEVMTFPLPETKMQTLDIKAKEVIFRFMEKHKVNLLALGPGISTNSRTQKLCREVIQDSPSNLVVDADALKSLRNNLGILKHRKANTVVLTPHLGEFSYLLKKPVEEIKKQRKEIVQDFSSTHRVILILKGSKTLVAGEGKIYENKTGNPGLSKAGTGDVLMGLVAGIMTQAKLSDFDSSRLAVYLHGLVADILKREKTILNFLAQDLIDSLYLALRKLRE